MEAFGVIYLAACAIHHKQYVGQTTKKPEKYFKRSHIQPARYGSTKVFHKAIRKYGVDNFTFEVIYVAFDAEELDLAEDYFIAEEYKTLAPDGYNMKRGGRWRGKFSKELIEKLRVAVKAAVNSPQAKANRAAREATPETKARRRIASIRSNAELDKEEQGRKISAGMTEEGKLRTHAEDVKERRYATLAATNALPEVRERRSAAQFINQARPEVNLLVRLRTRESLADPTIRARMSSSHKNLVWITDGTIETQISKDGVIPKDFKRGRLSCEKGRDLRLLALARGRHARHHKNSPKDDCPWCIDGVNTSNGDHNQCY